MPCIKRPGIVFENWEAGQRYTWLWSRSQSGNNLAPLGEPMWPPWVGHKCQQQRACAILSMCWTQSCWEDILNRPSYFTQPY